ncbi:hypothetical protein F1D05_04175 [Kribbella qitaiheensis]|uniref:Uncharacterized protein n=1 Tax=Kribbella qitaiheensis TaxID=1544730 RepID=A0A7G6WTE6_9ACTN|nr:hypothetical protein F1D05_04175 [Kribbella qitaiheensis]
MGGGEGEGRKAVGGGRRRGKEGGGWGAKAREGRRWVGGREDVQSAGCEGSSVDVEDLGGEVVGGG